jgi:SAM-dependent methyltransferase
MLTEFTDSCGFYQSPLGQRTLALLRAHVEDFDPGLSGARILTLGQSALLLGSTPTSCARMTRPDEAPFSCLVDSKNKPLPDASFDFVIALHMPSAFFEAESFLREVRRVLKGEGRFLTILPRHGGAWAQNTLTPFGCEPDFTTRQIRNILNNQGFIVECIDRALYAPPTDIWDSFSLADKIEIIAPWLFLHFGGGVLLVEVRKRVCGFAGCCKERRRRSDRLLPLPLPI